MVKGIDLNPRQVSIGFGLASSNLVGDESFCIFATTVFPITSPGEWVAGGVDEMSLPIHEAAGALWQDGKGVFETSK